MVYQTTPSAPTPPTAHHCHFFTPPPRGSGIRDHILVYVTVSVTREVHSGHVAFIRTLIRVRRRWACDGFRDVSFVGRHPFPVPGARGARPPMADDRFLLPRCHIVVSFATGEHLETLTDAPLRHRRSVLALTSRLVL